MEGHSDGAASSRIPKALKGLDAVSRQVFVYLRLRKNEQWIANKLNISLNDAGKRIDAVRSCLVKGNLIDLIEDPEFIPIENENGSSMPIPSGELSAEEKLIIKEAISAIRTAYKNICPFSKRLLKLRFVNSMTAKEILEFSRKTGVRVVDGKNLPDVGEQEIFSALGVALKELFDELQRRFGEDAEKFIDIETLKMILEETGI